MRRFDPKEVEDFFNISGASSNRVRPTTPKISSTPRSKTMTSSRDTATGSPLSIYISLDNFEDPKFENGKYVLTSPRSLESCSRLNIKPVELLHKPLLDYQEELLPQGVGLRTVYDLYDQGERERQNKLQLCYEERQQIIDEEEDLHSNADSCGPGSHRVNFKDGVDVDAGSMQRRRTAWATSIGHDRVTTDEIDNRALEIYEEGRRLKEHLARKVDGGSEDTLALKRTIQDTVDAGVRRRLFSKPRRPVSAPVYRKNLANKKERRYLSRSGKKALRKQAAEQEAAQQSQSPCQHVSMTTDKDYDRTDATSVTSTATTGSRLLFKNHAVDAKPITDPALRDKLKTARSPKIKVTAQDQKILQLMLKKRDEEQAQLEKKKSAQVQWEQERQRQEQLRKRSEEERIRTLSEKRHQYDKLRVGVSPGVTRSNSLSLVKAPTQAPNLHAHGCTHDHNHNHTKQEVLARRQSIEEHSHKCREDAVNCCDRHCRSLSQKQLELRDQKFREQAESNRLRKKSQEERRVAQLADEEERLAQLKQKQVVTLRRAQSLKDEREHTNFMQRKLKNYYAQKRHEERWNRLKRQSVEDVNNIRASIEIKDQLAQKKVEEAHFQRNSPLRQSVMANSKRFEQTRKKQEKIEGEMKSWQKDLLAYQRMQEEKAEEQARKAKEDKAKKAGEDRLKKEKLRSENAKKLNKAEEEYKADLEAQLALKDSRAKMILMEREEAIQGSRAMAQMSQRMREDLRRQYSMDEIHKLSHQALMENQLGSSRLGSATKNMSSLTLS